MIDRRSLTRRHDVRYAEVHRDAPLSVGNGEFAFTADVTGLQTFAADYERAAGRRDGVAVMPLGTQAQWCYHWAPNPEGFDLDDTLETFASPRGNVQYPTAYDYREDKQASADSGRGAGYYYWANPQRVHLAQIGFVSLDGAPLELNEIEGIDQRLDLWEGILHSRFRVRGAHVTVRTAVDPDRDALAVDASSPLFASGGLGIEVAFPSVEESFEAPPAWGIDDSHRTQVRTTDDAVDIERTIDETRYHVRIHREAGSSVQRSGPHALRIASDGTDRISVAVEFAADDIRTWLPTADVFVAAAAYWRSFWERGAAVDLSSSNDPRAAELERRVVLSQYQTAVNGAGSTPPQESGLVCNSWGGTFHLEMHWWHAAHFAAWGRPDLLERSFRWYRSILPVARETAAKQGFAGARWPKHVGPEGIESPNEIGPLLVWQQPHPIHFAELLYAATDEPERILADYAEVVDETAAFLASFAWREDDGWHLAPPLMPAQEIYGAEDTWDPLFELSYIRWALLVAQDWRRRRGLEPEPVWQEVADGLVPTVTRDGDDAWYDAVQRPPRTAFTDHPSMVGALGVVPDTGAIDHEAMWRTVERAVDEWKWESAWGWDFPMLAMCATRLGRSDQALDLLLRDAQKNTYLPNGHNMQVPTRLPLYLPGNGGLLMAVALMFGGWIDASGNRVIPHLPEGWSVEAEGFADRP